MTTRPTDSLAAQPDDHASIEKVRTDLACPSCGYNLRGLHGAIVRCPECGIKCDVARLVTRRWTQPWYRAPGFNTVLMPAAAAYVGLIAAPIVVAMLAVGFPVSRLATLAVTLAIAALWAWLIARAWRLFDGSRGLWLALLAHGILAGYVVGVFGVVGSVVTLVGAALSPGGPGLAPRSSASP